MPKKILLVEDEAILALSEAKMLEKNGYEITTTYSGEKAIEGVESNSDIDLGTGMDGTEAAEEILKSHDLPIAFLSSHTEPEIVEKTEGITSYGYIVKNSGVTVLLASIRMAFELYDAHIELKSQKEHLREALITQEHTKEELRKSEEKYRMLYENAPLPYHSLDEQGCFLEVNPAWLKDLGGYSREEVVGRSFADFLHPESKTVFTRNFESFKKKGSIEHVRFRMKTKGGEWIDVEFKGCIAYSPEGKFERTHCVFEDISGKKSAEECRAKYLQFQQLFDSMKEGVPHFFH